MSKKANKGSFKRLRSIPWTPERWDDGYVDNRGRFRVWRPDYPKAYALGYALRAHVVWWLSKGRVHPKGTNLHHMNQNKLDDRFENLKLIKHGEHTRLHSSKPRSKCRCLSCNKVFSIKAYRLSDSQRGKFCNQQCWNALRKRGFSRAAIRALTRIILEDTRLLPRGIAA